MHIKCTNGSPIVDTLDHLPPLPLFVEYEPTGSGDALTRQDESGIYHALRLYDRVYHIDFKLPPCNLQNVFLHLDGQFPKLEHLSLQFKFSASCTESKDSLPLTFPKAFLAPNLRHLTLPSISPPRRLRVLTSTVSLVTLEISKIQMSSYFRPRLLVARLQFLPQLKELFIGSLTPILRPSTEGELLGEQRTLVTLPSLQNLRFTGVGAYLESLVAQIRAPLLEQLHITLFNQIALVLPHLFNLINNTKVFKISRARVDFHRDEVCISTEHIDDELEWTTSLYLSVKCKSLDWQIDCAAQICHGLIPTLSGVGGLAFYHSQYNIPTELRNGVIDSATWHDLLRTFIGVKHLYINHALLEELSRALQVDEVGLDPEFLPNLQCIAAKDNHFTSFIDTRQVVGRPVWFVKK